MRLINKFLFLILILIAHNGYGQKLSDSLRFDASVSFQASTDDFLNPDVTINSFASNIKMSYNWYGVSLGYISYTRAKKTQLPYVPNDFEDNNYSFSSSNYKTILMNAHIIPIETKFIRVVISAGLAGTLYRNAHPAVSLYNPVLYPASALTAYRFNKSTIISYTYGLDIEFFQEKQFSPLLKLRIVDLKETNIAFIGAGVKMNINI